MADCPKCPASLRQKGRYWVCSNPYCGYRREVVKPVLSQRDLLKENEQLKEKVKELEALLRTH